MCRVSLSPIIHTVLTPNHMQGCLSKHRSLRECVWRERECGGVCILHAAVCVCVCVCFGGGSVTGFSTSSNNSAAFQHCFNSFTVCFHLSLHPNTPPPFHFSSLADSHLPYRKSWLERGSGATVAGYCVKLLWTLWNAALKTLHYWTFHCCVSGLLLNPLFHSLQSERSQHLLYLILTLNASHSQLAEDLFQNPVCILKQLV